MADKKPAKPAAKKEAAPKKEAVKKEAAPKKEAPAKATAAPKEAPKAEAKAAKPEAAKPAKKAAKASGLPRLQEAYESKIREDLKKKFGYTNPMAIPRLTKIVINMGVGEAVNDSKTVTNAASELEQISGQKPVITRSRKSIATFKLRDGQPIGCKVTLRKARMYEFLDRLVVMAMPRIRDFRGVPKRSFDGRGNYNLGIKEQLVFPEINYDKVDAVRGMDLTFVTTAKTDEEAKALLEGFQFPFI